MMESKRINYFDIAKGIGIILVVMGHLEYISSPIRFFIVSFHMPMFFVISGMLMAATGEENKPVSSYIKGKLKRIAVPYIGYSVLFLVLEIVFMYLTDTVSWINIIQNTYYTICLYGNSVLWFLPAMFFACLMFYFLRRKTNHKVTISIVIILTIIMYGLNKLNGIMGMSFSGNMFMSELFFFFVMVIRSFFAMFYLATGYYLYVLLVKQLDFTSKVKPVLMALIGICILALIGWTSQINGIVDFHFLMLGNPFLFLFNSVAGSIAVILICMSFEGISEIKVFKLIRFYGKNSLTIMATHMDCYIMYISLLFAMFITKNVNESKKLLFCTVTLITVFIFETILILCVKQIKTLKNRHT